MTHLPVGYFRPVTRSAYTFIETGRQVSGIFASFRPSSIDPRQYFACGRWRRLGSATTIDGEHYAVVGQVPSCPDCAVIWDQLCEKGLSV